MKTTKQIKEEEIKQSLAYKLVLKMDLSYNYDLLDYSGCYYEGDRPTINTVYLANKIQEALDSLGVK